MYEQIITKLDKQNRENPIIAFVDFDGTLYPGSRSMWRAPFYNHRTAKILKDLHIPLIVVTGRADWTRSCEQQMRFFGMHEDAVAAGAGSEMYVREKNNELLEDFFWDNHIRQSIFLWKDEKNNDYQENWDEQRIISLTQQLPSMKHLSLTERNQNKYAIRFTVRNLPIPTLEKIKQDLKNMFPHGIRILIAEKLFVKNTQDIFSGDVLLVPTYAGKDTAIDYIINNLADATQKKLHAYIFGDSSIDIKMLSMPETPTYNLSQYGVDLTPRAYTILKKIAVNNPNLHLFKETGPKIIYQTFSHLHKK